MDIRWPWVIYREHQQRKAEQRRKLEEWRRQDAITVAYMRRKVAEMEHQDMIRRAVDEAMRYK